MNGRPYTGKRFMQPSGIATIAPRSQNRNWRRVVESLHLRYSVTSIASPAAQFAISEKVKRLYRGPAMEKCPQELSAKPRTTRSYQLAHASPAARTYSQTRTINQPRERFRTDAK